MKKRGEKMRNEFLYVYMRLSRDVMLDVKPVWVYRDMDKRRIVTGKYSDIRSAYGEVMLRCNK